MSAAAIGHSSPARRWSRGILAGPVAFVTSAVVMTGGALWVPKGAASIDNIVLPIVVFPAIWAALFFYTCLDRKLMRAWIVTLALLIVNSAMIAAQFAGKGATP
jgi:undecaprenyl pyrophosphate phosphatase UppP